MIWLAVALAVVYAACWACLGWAVVRAPGVPADPFARTLAEIRALPAAVSVPEREPAQ